MKDIKLSRTVPYKKPVTLDMTEFQSVVLNQLNTYITQYTTTQPRKYSRDDLQRYLDRPEQSEKQLRELSLWLYLNSGPYRRIVNYFANMLTLDYLLIPDNKKIKTATFKRELDKVSKFLDNYNIKHEFSKITFSLVVAGIFYGVERVEGNSTMVQSINPDFCKLSSVVDGVYTFAVDCSMFDRDPKLIDNYHSNFEQMYQTYKTTGLKWQEVDDEIAVCFVANPMFTYPIPPLSGSFNDLLDLKDAKEQSIVSDVMSNYRLLVQKIPMKKEPKTEKDMVISAPTVKAFHNNIAASIPENIGLVSTPMDVVALSLDRSKDNDMDNVIRTEGNVFTSSAAGGIFNSRVDNSISLNRSINADESWMFSLLRSYERFFQKKLKQVSSYLWKIMFPDLTVYNRKDMLDAYTKLATFGFPKSLAFAASGMTLMDIANLNSFENDFLGIVDSMIPLSSSHTATAGEPGRPPTEDPNKLGDAGVQQKEDGSNDNRAQ